MIPQGALLVDRVQIEKRYVRSIDLSRDAENTQIGTDYVLTRQAIQVLQRLLKGLQEPQAHGRAYTLTGPYGTGKSAFALYLAHLLRIDHPLHSVAFAQLKERLPMLADELSDALQLAQFHQGLLPVLCSCHSAPPSVCLMQALNETLTHQRQTVGIPALLERIQVMLQDLRSRQEPNEKEVLSLLQQLTETFRASSGYGGLLIVLDELGKSLEYAARAEEGHLFFLQMLAEYANRTPLPGVVVIGILHQAFDRYARHLDLSAREEWAKVQGRYEDIAFYEPPEQLIRLIARALNPSVHEDPHFVNRLRNQARQAQSLGLCPPGFDKEEWNDLCLHVYPLHPTTLIALPSLFRRIAQNERSLFAYLSSGEPLGLQDFLTQRVWNPSSPPFVRLPDLCDYLLHNNLHTLTTQRQARPLLYAIDAIERLPDLTALEVQVLKTIGLLNMLSDSNPLNATEETIVFALSSPEYQKQPIRQAILNLRKRGLLTYRRFNHSYYVWEGSALDIEERLGECRRKIASNIRLAHDMQQLSPMQPFIAHRYSYETGALRYFEVSYLDIVDREVSLPAPSRTGADGCIVFCLPRTSKDYAAFQQWAQSEEMAERIDIVVALPKPLTHLYDLLLELKGLQELQMITPELQQDAVARREVQQRILEVQSMLNQELRRLMGMDGGLIRSDCQWFHQAEPLGNAAGKEISRLLSKVCEKLYPLCPRLQNELINRRTLSSTIAAARRNLLEAMLTRGHQPQLGIQGYPPEYSLYRSLLEYTRLHRVQPDGRYQFFAPDDQDPAHLRPCWNALTTRVFEAFPEPSPLPALMRELQRPPYGLMPTLFPVLLCAFWIIHQNEVSLYREGTFLPDPGMPDWEVLIRRPELFAIGGCRLMSTHKQMLTHLAERLQTEPLLVPVVRAIIKRMRALPEYAWRTRRLPENVIRMREAIQNARSPERLLLHDLPNAFNHSLESNSEAHLFVERLMEALASLEQATPALLTEAKEHLLRSCDLPPTAEGWHTLRDLAHSLKDRLSHPVLTPFLNRAALEGDEDAILESVLAYLAGRPPRAWTDTDREKFEAQARSVGELFVNLMLSHPLSPLPPEEEATSRQIAQEVENLIFARFPNISPAILQHTFRHLTHSLIHKATGRE